ncbi:MAG TPA: clostripain-related cysteine peptidase, partial [Candidatus Ozemobacteraceae bacterium]|nr:clostripain-related cysteine peptidase [Candidatus Ozemobacteraceae bacterium]
MIRPGTWLLAIAFICASVAAGLASAAEKAPKAWTYMIFMNADNDLDPFADEDFTELMRVGSSDWLNIVTITDREKGPAALHYVEKGNNVTVRELGEIDMGDWKTLVNFVKEVSTSYPARHYAVSLWNHGSGWKHTQKVFKGISYDDQSGNYITTAQLGQATREIKAILGKKLDLLTMDACLMQMMEIAWEVHKNVDYVVASEELEPGNGYPYDSHMAGLKPYTTPREFVCHMVSSFKTAYNGGVYGTEDTTQSAIDCSRLPALKDAIDGWAKAAMSGSYAQAYKQALLDVQKFDTKTNIDLWHLI